VFQHLFISQLLSGGLLKKEKSALLFFEKSQQKRWQK
jgi:hypothetical protein